MKELVPTLNKQIEAIDKDCIIPNFERMNSLKQTKEQILKIEEALKDEEQAILNRINHLREKNGCTLT